MKPWGDVIFGFEKWYNLLTLFDKTWRLYNNNNNTIASMLVNESVEDISAHKVYKILLVNIIIY